MYWARNMPKVCIQIARRVHVWDIFWRKIFTFLGCKFWQVRKPWNMFLSLALSTFLSPKIVWRRFLWENKYEKQGREMMGSSKIWGLIYLILNTFKSITSFPIKMRTKKKISWILWLYGLSNVQTQIMNLCNLTET